MGRPANKLRAEYGDLCKAVAQWPIGVEYRVLLCVAARPGAMNNKMSAELGISPEMVTYALGRARRKGWLEYYFQGHWRKWNLTPEGVVRAKGLLRDALVIARAVEHENPELIGNLAEAV